MKKKVLLIALILVFALGLTGCAPLPEEEPTKGTLELPAPSGSIIYYYDEVHQVGIWVYNGLSEGGVTALPARDIQYPSRPWELER